MPADKQGSLDAAVLAVRAAGRQQGRGGSADLGHDDQARLVDPAGAHAV